MPTTLEYFLAALGDHLDRGLIKQKDIAAKTETAPQTINAIVKGRKVPGLQKQEDIAAACGYEYIDFLILGRKLLGGDTDAPSSGDEKEDMSREAAMLAMAALVGQLSAAEDTLRVWKNAVTTILTTNSE